MTANNYHYLRHEIVSLLATDDLFAKAEKQPTRYSYAEAMLELGEKNPRVVVLDADVSKSVKTNAFAEKFPNRSFNFGVAEQNMMAAAGMATTGLIPCATTYAVFASMRALDMVRNSIHYPKLNVKIAARQTGAIVAAENNMFFGGLGSAVAEVLVENHPIPMKRIGVRDTFAESGPYPDLLDKYALSAVHIARAVEHVLGRKHKR